MERLVFQSLLEILALGDVAVVDDDAVDRGIVQEILGDRFERPPRAVGIGLFYYEED